VCSLTSKTEAYNGQYICHISLIVVLFTLCASNLNAQTSAIAKITVSVTIGAPQTSPIPQLWVDQFFGDIDPNYVVTSISDYDGDGQFDYFEYYAGTDPTNGASGLKIVESILFGNDAEITWTSTDSTDPEPRKYRIFRSGPEALGILAAPDATIEDLSLNTNITSLELNGELEINSAGDKTTYTDENVKDDFPLFYRVFLSKPEPIEPTD
jgi:hypothetical protein